LQATSKSAFAFEETLPKLIRHAVKEEEKATKAVVEQIGDGQASRAFGTLLQMKVHRRTGLIYGTESAEYIAATFVLAEKQLKSSNYDAAADCAINGLAAAEMLLGIFSESVVRGVVLLGNIYQLQGNTVQAIQYYRRALSYIEKKYREHPLMGTLSAKLYFCAMQLKRENDADKIAEAAIASDPSIYLANAFESFSDMFGSKAALMVLPMLGLDHGDHSFNSSITEFMHEADTSASLLETARGMWPKKALACVDQLQCQAGPGCGGAALSPLAVLSSLSGITEESLRECGVDDAREISRILEALSTATEIAAKATTKLQRSLLAQSLHSSASSMLSSTSPAAAAAASSSTPSFSDPPAAASSPSPPPVVRQGVAGVSLESVSTRDINGYYSPQSAAFSTNAAPSPSSCPSPPAAKSTDSYTTPF